MLSVQMLWGIGRDTEIGGTISAATTTVSGGRRCDASSLSKHGPLVVAFAADRVSSRHRLTETPAETVNGNHGRAFLSGRLPPMDLFAV